VSAFFGIGMFFYGMGALIIGALMVWYVINKIGQNNGKKK